MKPFFRKKASTRGFTLLEMAVVLGIVGLIIAAIWIISGRVMEQRRVSNSAEQVLKIVDNMRTYYSGKPDVPVRNLNNELWDQGIFPSDIRGPERGILMNYWGGRINLFGVAPGDRFRIATDHLPRSSCIRLVLATMSTDDNNLLQRHINNVVVPVGDVTVRQIAEDSCTLPRNSLRWTFHLRR
ncbi:MAG: type II secretion system GspH family protein [Pseudomonadota bacterium]|nr:type II secretion system GspH family protein [Pseudomonadota bacterium]